MAGEELFQPGATLDERQPAEIFSVEMQEVEREEDDRVRLARHRSAERMEVGDAARVLHDRFAIEDCRPAFEFVRGLDQSISRSSRGRRGRRRAPCLDWA